ncbi:unnamed protein product, partial [Effrenium voratum]
MYACGCCPERHKDGCGLPEPADPRQQLQQLVCSFVYEATSRGQPCRVLKPPEESREAEYRLLGHAEQLELRAASATLGCWDLEDLSLRRAEEVPLVAPETAGRAVALGPAELLVVLPSQEDRDRFICVLQILQLYQGLAGRFNTFTTPRRPAASSRSARSETAQTGLLR